MAQKRQSELYDVALPGAQEAGDALARESGVGSFILLKSGVRVATRAGCVKHECENMFVSGKRPTG